ncbi:MAG: hypothetical protein WB660_24845 [Candidatus Sulfotelmatobacter sp.]
MKVVAILLLVALSFSSCSTPSVTQVAQSAAGGVWSAQVFGGSGEVSGFSFTTQFTVNTDGSLTITYFQFLTEGSCFPVDGGTQTGSMILTINAATEQLTGPFTYTVQASNNTLTLNGVVTGTESGTMLTGGSITGTWQVTGTGCSTAGGTFTMTQSS